MGLPPVWLCDGYVISQFVFEVCSHKISLSAPVPACPPAERSRVCMYVTALQHAHRVRLNVRSLPTTLRTEAFPQMCKYMYYSSKCPITYANRLHWFELLGVLTANDRRKAIAIVMLSPVICSPVIQSYSTSPHRRITYTILQKKFHPIALNPVVRQTMGENKNKRKNNSALTRKCRPLSQRIHSNVSLTNETSSAMHSGGRTRRGFSAEKKTT